MQRDFHHGLLGRIVCVIAGLGAGVALSLDASVLQPAQRVTSLGDTMWRLVTFDETRPTEYAQAEEQGRTVVSARSDSGVAGLVAELPRDLAPHAISWQWRVDQCLDNDHERERSGDDYAARVFVLYGRESARTPWGWLRRRMADSPFGHVVPKRAVSYVWASGGQWGDVYRNPGFRNVSTMVLEDECHPPGTWVSERRELAADFSLAFRGSMPEVVGVALMTDTDDTRSQAVTWYADVTLHLSSGGQLALPFGEIESGSGR